MGLEQCPAQAHHPAQTLHRNLNQLSSHFRNRRSARTAPEKTEAQNAERERRSTEWEIRSEITEAQNGNLPIKLLMPNAFQNIKEIAPKTITRRLTSRHPQEPASAVAGSVCGEGKKHWLDAKQVVKGGRVC